jgi:hypothetical protein
MTKNHELHRSPSRVAVCVCVCVCFLFFASAAVGQTSPNVLLIAVDDLRTELGCYGVADAQSPHLDRFARQAILFNHHYVQVPTCGASRYALLTGRSPRNSGVTSNNAALYQGATALKADSRLSNCLYWKDIPHARWKSVCLQRKR